MKKNNKLKIFFTVAIVEMIVVAIFIGYFTYGIISKSETLHKQTVILQQKTQLAEIANDLENQKTETEKKIASIKGTFFNDQSLMQFLKGLDDTASAYGLSINQISFGKLKPSADTVPPIMLLPVSMSISGGNYDNVVKFLAYLEKMGYSIKPTTISITVAPVSRNTSLTKQKGSQVSVSFAIYVETNSKEIWSYSEAKP